jgi:NodT family efflux transporter outer membrane factor (OMF) lipoprotein
MSIRSILSPTAALLGLTALGGCNLAPHYHVPTSAPAPAYFKGAPGWVVAQPADAVAKGEWWRLFNDPRLDELEARVVVTNQNVAAARAAYDQARALVRQDRAALFPTVSAGAGVTRNGTFGSNSTGTINSNGTLSTTGTRFSTDIAASWAPDLWGAIGNSVRQARAQAQASAGQLANATLSAQGELASDYLQLRGLDAQKILLDETVIAYGRSLKIARNKYNAGTVARSDVYTAQSALSSAQASLRDLVRQRAVFEDAIAVLVGENPSTFALAPAPWQRAAPDVPYAIPTEVIQRRPDVAAAERSVAAANANIGIQKAAFFPSLSLSGSASTNAASLGSLFSAATSFWSLGASAAETLLDFGARSAKVAGARAAYDQAVASYRQTVLTAFQQVEDNLSAMTVYRAEMVDLAAAADAADHALTIANNQYKAGTVDYTTVVTAQTTHYSARQKLIQTVVSRQTSAVSLIQALGGEWTSAACPASQTGNGASC